MNTFDSRHPDRGAARTRRTLVAGVSSALFLSAALFAQTGPAPAGRASGASPQNATPAAAPDTGIDSVKTQIKATDAEWKVIGPKLQTVVTARQTVMTYATAGGGAGALFGGGGPGFMGRGGPGGPGGFGRDSLDGPGAPGGPFGRGGPDLPPGVDPSTFLGGRGGRGGPGGPPAGFDPAAFAANNAGGAPPPMGGGANAISAALDELKTTLANAASTPEQAKAKLAAVRLERKKAESNLAVAQKALLLVITPAQETTLVSLGYLD